MMNGVAIDDNRGYRLLEEALGELAFLLEQDNVIEVYCNSNNLYVWAEYAGIGRKRTGIELSIEAREQILKIVASFCNTITNKENSIISAELPKYGYRFEGSFPDTTILPSFNIRKPASVVFSLDDYVSGGMMTIEQEKIIKQVVRRKMNIIVGGGTGSGKTTLCNAVLQEISKIGDRLCLIEDTRELQCTADDYESFRTSDNVSTLDLIHTNMRRRPDRIIVGEVRDRAAYDLLKAWNTGHPGGVSTTHANSALETLTRLESLSLEAGSATSIPPVDVIRDLIGTTIGLIVFISRSVKILDGVQVKSREVKEVVLCTGYSYEKKAYSLEYDAKKILRILEGK